MRFFHTIIIVALLLLVPVLIRADTLCEAVQQGLITNPDVLSNRSKTLSAKKAIGVAKGAFYPSIDLAAAGGREYSDNPTTQAIEGDGKATLTRRETSVEVRQKIFAGGGLVSEYQRKEFVWQGARWKTMGVAEDLALDVINRYLTVLLHEKLYALAIENYNRHLPIMDMINARAESGLSRTSDVDQANGRLAEAEANRISAEANLREARINYAKVVGKWPDKLVYPRIPTKQELPCTLNEAIEIGLESHPNLKSTYADVKQAKAQYSVAQADFFPKVDFVINASFNSNLDGLTGANNDAMAMFRVNYNFFRGGSDLARAKELAYTIQEAYENKNRSIIDLKEAIRLGWNTWLSSQLRLVPLKQHVTAAQKTRLAYQEQFKLSKRTLLDLLDSQNELFRAENDYARGKMDEAFARYRILNGMGQLLPYLNMRLPINVTNDDVFSSAQKHVLLDIHDEDDIPYPNRSDGPMQLSGAVPTFEDIKLTPEIVNNNNTIPNQVPMKKWYISTGPCKTKDMAIDMAKHLIALGFEAYPCRYRNRFDVLIGPYEYREHAGNVMARLKQVAKVDGLLVTYKWPPTFR